MASAELNGADSASDLLAVPDEVTQRRFGGLGRLYGIAGAQRIRGAHVVVVGVGGVGSWAFSIGPQSGRLTLIDMDHVAESNSIGGIQRTFGHCGSGQVVRPCVTALPRSTPVAESTALTVVDADNWPGCLQVWRWTP